MAERRDVPRRVFLSDLGKGALAIAVFGLTAAACAADAESGTTSAGSNDPDSAASLHRVNLGFVSAYVLARGGEAAIVDTGVSGSAPAISDGLAAAGLSWDSVGHVILTHLHPDHIGSLGDVLGNASSATGYAGAADIPEIPSPRPLTAIGDGDSVFDLQIIGTPGHTAGHISVLEPISGTLVAGDAINGVAGGVAGANPDFTADMNEANRSITKLATFSFDTVVFGHGEPVEGGASAAVAELASGL